MKVSEIFYLCASDTLPREASARVVSGLYNGLTDRNGCRHKDEKRSRTQCQRWANPQGASQSRLHSTWKPFGLMSESNLFDFHELRQEFIPPIQK